jgi:hypothetical protein
VCRRDLFLTGPGPDSGSSKAYMDVWAQWPEKFGIDALPWLGCCVNAADENRAAAALVKMMTFRMMDFYRQDLRRTSVNSAV